MRLRELRFHRGVSQLEVAFAVGISQTKFSLIERGYIFPNKSERARISEFLGVSPDEIQWNKARTQKSEIENPDVERDKYLEVTTAR